MGQYHMICNYDKKQYLHAHEFGDGLKLMEFGASPHGTMLGLAILLAASNGRGGGDIHPWVGGGDRYVPGLTKERGDWLIDNVVGAWAGDRIAIIGDYNEPEDAGGLVEREGSPYDRDHEELFIIAGSTVSLYEKCEKWTNVSGLVVEAIEMDYYTHKSRHEPDANKDKSLRPDMILSL